MSAFFGTLLMLIVLAIGAVLFGFLTYKLGGKLLCSVAGIMSILSDLITFAIILFGLHGVIPLHFSSAFWDWVSYIIVIGTLFYYLRMLRLVKYSSNYLGATVLWGVILQFISSDSASLAVAILLPLLARVLWICSRFGEGEEWVEERYSFLSNTSYGHSHTYRIDSREKSLDEREVQDRWMPVQVIIAGVLYLVSTTLIFFLATETKGDLPIAEFWYVMIGVAGAIINVLIDLQVMKKIDDHIDETYNMDIGQWEQRELKRIADSQK